MSAAFYTLMAISFQWFGSYQFQYGVLIIIQTDIFDVLLGDTLVINDILNIFYSGSTYTAYSLPFVKVDLELKRSIEFAIFNSFLDAILRFHPRKTNIYDFSLFQLTATYGISIWALGRLDRCLYQLYSISYTLQIALEWTPLLFSDSTIAVGHAARNQTFCLLKIPCYVHLHRIDRQYMESA